MYLTARGLASRGCLFFWLPLGSTFLLIKIALLNSLHCKRRASRKSSRDKQYFLDATLTSIDFSCFASYFLISLHWIIPRKEVMQNFLQGTSVRWVYTTQNHISTALLVKESRNFCGNTGQNCLCLRIIYQRRLRQCCSQTFLISNIGHHEVLIFWFRILLDPSNVLESHLVRRSYNDPSTYIDEGPTTGFRNKLVG